MERLIAKAHLSLIIVILVFNILRQLINKLKNHQLRVKCFIGSIHLEQIKNQISFSFRSSTNDAQSWGDVNSWSLKHIERPVYIIEFIHVAIVLILGTICEECDTHVLNTIFTELLPAVQLGENLLSFLRCDAFSARWSLVHLNLVPCALSLLLFILSIA